ncbi:RHS repeat-associated core domain-containing protein [Nitrincola sp. MINF-07-Sa-05]|uniref:RHS repeat-associated core domain-containing protein n=1 Tax=Nitrincola salilacus TaxID=3400273 RepID=UPI003917E587
MHEDAGDQRTTVFYEPGSFIPLFRVDETKRTEQLDDHWMLREPQDPSDEPAYDTHYSAFVTDHLGTPMKLIGSDGHLLWTAKPDDWAAIRDEKAVPDLKQPIRFQGQWLDEETGLYYNRYRFYDPRQGRYITQDPIGLAGGMNSYAYVGNPTGWVDPLGLDALKGRDTGSWAQTKAYAKGALSYPSDVFRSIITAGSTACESIFTVCAKNVENSRRIGRAIYEYNHDHEVAANVDKANKLGMQAVMNDPVIQAQIAGRATVATIIGATGIPGMGLNTIAITGGMLRSSEAGGEYVNASELMQGALGVDLQ